MPSILSNPLFVLCLWLPTLWGCNTKKHTEHALLVSERNHSMIEAVSESDSRGMIKSELKDVIILAPGTVSISQAALNKTIVKKKTSFGELDPSYINSVRLHYPTLDQDLIQLTLPDALIFQVDRHTMSLKAKEQLSHIVQHIQHHYQDHVIFVVGHTDSNGSEHNNYRLSSRRAISVAEAMGSLGLNHQQLRIVPMGESQPLVANVTPGQRQRNRRVSLFISPSRPLALSRLKQASCEQMTIDQCAGQPSISDFTVTKRFRSPELSNPQQALVFESQGISTSSHIKNPAVIKTPTLVEKITPEIVQDSLPYKGNKQELSTANPSMVYQPFEVSDQSEAFIERTDIAIEPTVIEKVTLNLPILTAPAGNTKVIHPIAKVSNSDFDDSITTQKPIVNVIDQSVLDFPNNQQNLTLDASHAEKSVVFEMMDVVAEETEFSDSTLSVKALDFVSTDSSLYQASMSKPSLVIESPVIAAEKIEVELNTEGGITLSKNASSELSVSNLENVDAITPSKNDGVLATTINQGKPVIVLNDRNIDKEDIQENNPSFQSPIKIETPQPIILLSSVMNTDEGESLLLPKTDSMMTSDQGRMNRAIAVKPRANIVFDVHERTLTHKEVRSEKNVSIAKQNKQSD